MLTWLGCKGTVVECSVAEQEDGGDEWIGIESASDHGARMYYPSLWPSMHGLSRKGYIAANLYRC